jgi:hypothetical protein
MIVVTPQRSAQTSTDPHGAARVVVSVGGRKGGPGRENSDFDRRGAFRSILELHRAIHDTSPITNADPRALPAVKLEPLGQEPRAMIRYSCAPIEARSWKMSATPRLGG